jgi:hypothetical protein
LAVRAEAQSARASFEVHSVRIGLFDEGHCLLFKLSSSRPSRKTSKFSVLLSITVDQESNHAQEIQRNAGRGSGVDGYGDVRIGPSLAGGSAGIVR